MRIIHAANLGFDKFGAVYMNQDQKLQHGLIRLGHFVYTFSVNDLSRQLGFGQRDLGVGKVNKALIQCCEEVRPDLLLLGHAQLIKRATLETIRERWPQIKIAFWYVDPLWIDDATEHIRVRGDLFDAMFCTTAGEPLAELGRGRCRSAFIPNVVDDQIENLKAFEQPEHDRDLVFIGNDKRDLARREQLRGLSDVFSRSELNFETFGSLGRPPAYGSEKDQILLATRAALNMSRHDRMPLYCSSRVAEMMGNGLLTCSPRGAGLEELYPDQEMVHYDGHEDLLAQLEALIGSGEWRAVAERGWRRNHEQYNGTAVAKFMIDFTYDQPAWRDVSWARHHFEK